MGLGIWQVLLILVVVLIIFGAGKLPKVMQDLGKGLKSFKNAMQDNEPEKKKKKLIKKNKK